MGITLGPLDNPRQSPHLKILNSLRSAKYFMSYMVTYSQILGIRTWTSLGGPLINSPAWITHIGHSPRSKHCLITLDAPLDIYKCEKIVYNNCMNQNLTPSNRKIQNIFQSLIHVDFSILQVKVDLFFIVVQLQLSPFCSHYSPPPYLPLPPTSILHIDFSWIQLCATQKTLFCFVFFAGSQRLFHRFRKSHHHGSGIAGLSHQCTPVWKPTNNAKCSALHVT